MIIEGLLSVLTLETLFFIIIGVAIGIVFGSIPGLTANMAVALCLPLTYKMTPIMGISTLIALYVGGISGGLIAAILINIPGTPSSVATCFDGWPLAKKGEAGKALGVGISASFLGTVLSIATLIFIAPLLARAALKFGPYEYFAISVFALTMIGSLISDSALLGISGAVLGICISLVGIAPVGGVLRFTFGLHQLDNGFDILPVLIGLFAVSEIFIIATSPKDMATDTKVIDYKLKGLGFTWKEARGQWWNFLRSALIGIGIGILPGIGGGTSNIVAYSVAKQQSKYPEKFGTGIIDGVVASETANNASIGGAMIPLLTLGIPGDTVTAILLGGLVIHGINPGPLLFQNSGVFVYGVFFALIIATVVMVVMEYAGLRLFAKVLRVPKYILLPVIMALCCVGAFGLNNRIFDILVALIMGVVGFALIKLKVPLPPLLLGFILGPVIELNLIRGLMFAQNDVFAFIRAPIAAAFLFLSLLVVGLTAWKQLKRRDGHKETVV
jgi:putative tricarboxylic transport membrane protein